VKAYRIKSKPKSPAADQQQQQQHPPPIIVEFENLETRNSVVAAGKQLANSNFKSVYIRPDRTLAEQAEFNRLHKERKEANDDLVKHNLLINPFRFVIRGDRVRCVDVKETLDNNKHPFVQWKIACDARKGKTPNTQ
jgi:hypothetical protein